MKVYNLDNFTDVIDSKNTKDFYSCFLQSFYPCSMFFTHCPNAHSCDECIYDKKAVKMVKNL